MITISEEDKEFLRLNAPDIYEVVETGSEIDILDLINRAIYQRCIDEQCTLDETGMQLQMIYNRLDHDN